MLRMRIILNQKLFLNIWPELIQKDNINGLLCRVDHKLTSLLKKNKTIHCYYVFILNAISPYTTVLKALFNPTDCISTDQPLN